MLQWLRFCRMTLICITTDMFRLFRKIMVKFISECLCVSITEISFLAIVEQHNLYGTALEWPFEANVQHCFKSQEKIKRGGLPLFPVPLLFASGRSAGPIAPLFTAMPGTGYIASTLLLKQKYYINPNIGTVAILCPTGRVACMLLRHLNTAG